MSIDAMKHALEALELLTKYENPSTKWQIRKPRDGGPIVTVYPHHVASDAAAALRAAIEKAQEPQCAHGIKQKKCGWCGRAPKQKPVAWVTGFHDGYCVIGAADPAAILPMGIALYTTPQPAMPTMDDAIAAGDSVLMTEQAALLRECRAALDSLIAQKPTLAGLVCGSTTLGNLKAELYAYRPQGVFGAAPRQWQGLTEQEVKDMWQEAQRHQFYNIETFEVFARAIQAKLKEKNHAQ